jgi:hypothetical protein
MEVRDADKKSGAGQERVEAEEYKYEYNFRGRGVASCVKIVVLFC